MRQKYITGAVCLIVLTGSLWWCAWRIYDYQRHYQQQLTMQERLTTLQSDPELQKYSVQEDVPFIDQLRMNADRQGLNISSIEEKDGIVQADLSGSYLAFLDLLEALLAQPIAYQLEALSINKATVGVVITMRWKNA
jgi:hypothetical protein